MTNVRESVVSRAEGVAAGARACALPGRRRFSGPASLCCSSGSADSPLTFLFPVDATALCSCVRVALETVLSEQNLEWVFRVSRYAAAASARSESVAADEQTPEELGGGASGLPAATETTSAADGGGA